MLTNHVVQPLSELARRLKIRWSAALVLLGCIALVAALPEVQSAPASFQQAVADYKAGHVSTALSEFQSYKVAYPTNALVRYYIGLCYQQLGHTDEARAELLWVGSFGDARLQGLAGAALRQLSPRASTTPGTSKAGAGSLEADRTSTSELESYCLSLVNESRTREGLPALQSDAALSQLARRYADYMAQHAEQYELSVPRSVHIDLEGHNQIERAEAAGLISVWRGECIGRTSRGGPSDKAMVLEVHQKMMNEPQGYGHRENILNHDANVVGIAIARLPRRLYLAEEFGQR